MYKDIEDNFSGDMTVLRAIFSNKDPLLAYHMLKTEIPYGTLLEYVEYLDVYESIKEQQEKEMQEEIEKARSSNKK